MQSLQQQQRNFNQPVARLGEQSIQPKLKIGQPDDKYEREADRVADAVMRMPDPQLQMQPLEEEEETLQMKPVMQMQAGDNTYASPKITQQISASKGQGSLLSYGLQREMSHKMGNDFSSVKIHTNSKAVQMNRQLGAKAFTHGSDIYFNKGEYNPSSKSGKRLLAHELTHVMQQNGRIYEKNRNSRHRGKGKIMCYRRGGPNFGACDTNSLKEKKYKKGDPWIETISINFNNVKKKGSDDSYPLGELEAKYHKDKLSGFTSSIAGGYASAGLSDSGTHKVKKIKGCGYHSSNSPSIPERKRLKKGSNRYYKAGFANESSMSYALFYKGLQAIHEGSLGYGSLACVHVPGASKMRQLNYHSRRGKTEVKIKYESKTLEKLCCDRYKHMGYMVSNPCGSVDNKKC